MRRTFVGVIWGLSFIGGIVSACALQRRQAPIIPPPIVAARFAVLTDVLAWIDDTLPVLRFTPPAIYGMWRLEVEQCSGRTRAGWPTFYIAPHAIRLDEVNVAGVYSEASQSIVFSLGAEVQRAIVQHEVLHWLITPTLPPAPADESVAGRIHRQHPAEYFEARCGAVLHAP